MQKLILFLCLNFLALQYLSGQSGCLPESITFTTQEEIDNFQADYPGCTDIEGWLTISGDDITNLEGLNVLTSVAGTFRVFGTGSLTSLAGLENLATVGYDFIIAGNTALVNLSGLENLTTITGNFAIGYNEGLVNFEGIENVTTIGGNLSLAMNNQLTSFEGLEGLITVGGDVKIGLSEQGGNAMLSDLSGLDNLTSIGGKLSIRYNNAMTSLTGVGSLISIQGELDIQSNGALASLSGLDNLGSIGGSLTLGDDYSNTGNSALTDISSLAGLDAGSVSNLKIKHNSSLSACEVESICNYLASPNGSVAIQYNAQGCASIGQVEQACGLIGIEEALNTHLPEIRPNPAENGIIHIMCEDVPGDLRVCFINAFGQMVRRQEIIGTETSIDCAGWPAGIYLAVVYQDGKPSGGLKVVVR